MLEQAGIAFTGHSYSYDPAASRVGLQPAEDRLAVQYRVDPELSRFGPGPPC